MSTERKSYFKTNMKTSILKNLGVAFAIAGFGGTAGAFDVPEAEIIVPIHGEAERLENMFEITWGYYGLVDNAGDDPIQATLIFPSGRSKTVKGTITDANAEGEATKEVPTTEDNALMFRNFQELEEDDYGFHYVQEPGVYTVNIPAGIVLVNGVPNPASTLNFKITGSGEPDEPKEYLLKASLIYPSNEFLSYISSAEMTWGENVSLANGVETATIDAYLDGIATPVTVSVQYLADSGENDATDEIICALYVDFGDFISYAQTTNVDIVLPEGLVTNSFGKINPEQTFSFYLYESIEGTSDPASGSKITTDMADITISWNGVSLMPNTGNIVARNAEGRDTELSPVFNEDASLKLQLSDLIPGKYEIIIPEAYVIIVTKEGAVEDEYAINQEMYLEYTLEEGTSSAVETIDASEGKTVIYGIEGRTMQTHAVESLEPGLYIVNGQKILVK